MTRSKLKLIYLLIGFVYFIFPFDLIPDLIRPYGYIDDLLFSIYLFWRFNKYAPETYTKYRSLEDEASEEKTPEKPFDPYLTLQVMPSASLEEIEAQYKKLVAQYHPDKVNHLGEELQKAAHEKMIDIQRAYRELREKFH